jgi:hypothetical protein
MDEAFRTHMLSVPEVGDIQRDPNNPESVQIDFKNRRAAEVFWNNSKSIPELGEIEMAWIRKETSGQTSNDASTASMDTGA